MLTEEYFPQFFTASIHRWKPILQYKTCKQIIIDSLSFLSKEKRITVYAFVIMPNHIHLIWKINNGHLRKNVQRDFLKFTGQQIKFYLQSNHPNLLECLKVEAKDRSYKIWQRNALSIDLYSEPVFEQKLDYIHSNPCQARWQLSIVPEHYKYSSAYFYTNNSSTFSFLVHYKDA